MEQAINANKRISKRRLTEYINTLSDRDKAVLRSIRRCRFIQTDQVGRLHFQAAKTPSARLRAANRTLIKLHGLGLIQSLNRRIGGVRAGSTSYVWTIKAAGAALLDLVDSKPFKPVRAYEPTYFFLKHTLAVVEVYARLHTMSGVKLITTELEPTCWRNYMTARDGNVILKPDLYAVTAVGGYEDYWFFEVDLDTETPKRIVRKCEYYGKYYLTGQEQKSTGVFPRVVWIAPDEKRRATLQRHISANLSGYQELFTVITLEDLTALMQTGAPPVLSQA